MKKIILILFACFLCLENVQSQTMDTTININYIKFVNTSKGMERFSRWEFGFWSNPFTIVSNQTLDSIYKNKTIEKRGWIDTLKMSYRSKNKILKYQFYIDGTSINEASRFSTTLYRLGVKDTVDIRIPNLSGLDSNTLNSNDITFFIVTNGGGWDAIFNCRLVLTVDTTTVVSGIGNISKPVYDISYHNQKFTSSSKIDNIKIYNTSGQLLQEGNVTDEYDLQPYQVYICVFNDVYRKRMMILN